MVYEATSTGILDLPERVFGTQVGYLCLSSIIVDRSYTIIFPRAKIHERGLVRTVGWGATIHVCSSDRLARRIGAGRGLAEAGAAADAMHNPRAAKQLEANDFVGVRR